MSKDKYDNLFKQSRKMFIIEARNKLQNIMVTFLEYYLTGRESERYKIENFFHSIKGMAAISSLDELTEISNILEDFMSKTKGANRLSNDEYLKLLDGFAKIWSNIDFLYNQFCTGVQEQKCEDFTIISDLSLTNEGEKEIEIEGISNINKAKILIVEDVSVTIYLIKTRLEELNYKIYYATDGLEAINKSREVIPDIILLDLMLPKLDGFEVCKRIKDDPLTKDVKIIIMSSKKSDEDILRCFQLGVEDYLIKPFSLKQLEKKIKKLI